MNMRELTDEERVLLAEFRLCEEAQKAEILDRIQNKAADTKAAERADSVQTDTP